MPEDQPYSNYYYAGEIFSPQGLLSAGEIWEEATVITAGDVNKSGFFLSLSWSWRGNIVVNLSSQVDFRTNLDQTMFILGEGNGEFKVETLTGSKNMHVTAKPCPQMYVHYSKEKGLVSCLSAYFKNIETSQYHTALRDAAIAEDDVLFCIVSANGKGATLKSPPGQTLLKHANVFGHDTTSQSSLGFVGLVKKENLDKLTVDIPANTTSFGFFMAASAVDPNIYQLSRGCVVVFKP